MAEDFRAAGNDFDFDEVFGVEDPIGLLSGELNHEWRGMGDGWWGVGGRVCIYIKYRSGQLSSVDFVAGVLEESEEGFFGLLPRR